MDTTSAANQLAAAFGSVSGAGALAEQMGITITEASADRVVGTMPVSGNTQPYGLLHGGASCVLAETLGSIGAAMHALSAFDGQGPSEWISARRTIEVRERARSPAWPRLAPRRYGRDVRGGDHR
jgi:acyl-coenzyme A thioesterase PaaI-like protein